MLCHFSRVQLCDLWTVACQAPLPMGFSRQEYRSGLHALLQGSFPSQESNRYLWHLLLGRQVLYPLSHLGSPQIMVTSEPVKLLSCVRLCKPMDYSLSGSSIHGIFQAKVLEWVAISFSRGSSQPGDQTQVFHITADALPSEPLGKLPNYGRIILITF